MYEQWAIFIDIDIYIFCINIIKRIPQKKQIQCQRFPFQMGKDVCGYGGSWFSGRRKRIQSVLNESLETFTFIRMNTDGQVHVLMGFQHPFFSLLHVFLSPFILIPILLYDDSMVSLVCNVMC